MLIGSDLQQASIEYKATNPSTDLQEGRIFHDGNNAKIFLGKNWSMMGLPLGTPIAIVSSLTGAWIPPASGVLKDGFQLMDGAAIHADAVMSGILPDMTDSRFIMGSVTAGVLAEPLHTHTYPHIHQWGKYITGALHSPSSTTYDENGITIASTDHYPIYMSGTTPYTSGGANETMIFKTTHGPEYYTTGALRTKFGEEANNGANIETDGSECLPPYLSAIYVMRVA